MKNLSTVAYWGSSLRRWYHAQGVLVEWLIAGSLLLLVITLAHGSAVRANWSVLHWEDALFFEHVRDLLDKPWQCFTHPSLWPGLYRPITTNCYYTLGGIFFDHQIEFYHAINLLVYGLNALLLYGLARHVLAMPHALLAMALFASRSAHAEVVTNTVEFQILAATAFALLALLLFIHALQRQQWSLLAVVYAALILLFLSKEAAVATIALLPLYVWLFFRAIRWRYLLIAMGMVAGTVLLFLAALYSFVEGESTGFGFAATPATVLQNIATYFWSFSNWFAHDEQNLILPDRLAAMGASTAGQALFLLWLGLLLVLAIWKQRIGHAGRLVAFGGLCFLLMIAPYTILVDRLFMRYGYASHAGLALAAAALVAWSVAALRRIWRSRVHRRMASIKSS